MGARTFTYKGETHTLTEWAKIRGVKYNKLNMRLLNGWTIERALAEEDSEATLTKKTQSRNRTTKPILGDKATTSKQDAGTQSKESEVSKERMQAKARLPRKATVAASESVGVSKPPEQGGVAPIPPPEMPMPKKRGGANRDFMRGMAEGIWLVISSVAMMMAESGEDVAGKNLRRMEEMFKGGIADQFGGSCAES